MKLSDKAMDSIFTLLWVTVVPLVALTMVLGKVLTFLLLGVGLAAYFHHQTSLKKARINAEAAIATAKYIAESKKKTSTRV